MSELTRVRARLAACVDALDARDTGGDLADDLDELVAALPEGGPAATVTGSSVSDVLGVLADLAGACRLHGDEATDAVADRLDAIRVRHGG